MRARARKLKYLLDTDTVIYLVHRRSAAVAARFARLRASEVAISCIAFGELSYGAEKSAKRDASVAILEAFSNRIAVLPIDGSVSTEYGRIRAALEAQGRPLGNNDLWIAAHALSAGLILVTNNVREFGRVPDLEVENWATDASGPEPKFKTSEPQAGSYATAVRLGVVGSDRSRPGPVAANAKAEVRRALRAKHRR
jgi:tRNA(fMet)-specific endonuclease VapC